VFTPCSPSRFPSRADGTSGNDEVLRTLERAGVDARVMVFAETEYVVWDEADVTRAEEALGFSAEMREAMRAREAGRARKPRAGQKLYGEGNSPSSTTNGQ
jgi:hypothetical protein